MSLHSFARNVQPHDSAVLRRGRNRKLSVQQLRTFAHGHQPNPALHLSPDKTFSVILNLQLEPICKKS